MTIELHISRMFRGPLIILMKSCVTCHAIKEKLTFCYEHIDSSRFFGGWGGGERECQSVYVTETPYPFA